VNGELHDNVLCPVCGRPPVAVGHLHKVGSTTFEYVHLDDDTHRIEIPTREGYVQEILESTADPWLRLNRLAACWQGTRGVENPDTGATDYPRIPEGLREAMRYTLGLQDITDEDRRRRLAGMLEQDA
jgi:hypothetical protein